MQQLTLNTLSLRIYTAESPVAVVQIAHGMEEHQGRYSDFAEYLTTRGFTVVTADMRGHGETVAPSELGWFADRDGWKLLVADQLAIRDFISERFPDLPVYLFAHSMGTIISRVVLESASKRYDKVVLSGFPCYQTGTEFGIFLARTISAIRGSRHKSKLLQTLSTGMFNRAIESPATDFDWVCKTPESVQKFIDDPLCGFGFTSSALGDLFKLVSLMHDPKKYVDVNVALPFLMVSGAEDPCTGGEKGRADSIGVLRRAGFSEIKEIAYPDMRHEILNEREHMKVYEDIANFLL
ncbi:MAG: alpha/beta hydrolase [Clostridiales bacterium]|nr:alpha/beta hydrolase [Clostridiales bacterium]